MAKVHYSAFRSAAAAFAIAFPAAAAAQTLFDDVRVDYPMSSTPADMESGDFNGDTIRDVAFVRPDSSHLTILLGRGDGSFYPPLTSTLAQGPRGLAAGDIDGDGDVDLVAALQSGGGVRKLINDGNANFSNGGLVATTSAANDVILAKMDAGTTLDIVSNSTSGLQIFTNNGTGTFTAGAVGFLSGTMASMVPADMDGDGDLDIVGIKVGGLNCFVLPNNGGTFGTSTSHTTGSSPQRLAVFDKDGDTDLDVVIANYDSDNLTFLTNNGSGVLTGTTPTPALDGPSCPVPFDADGDGDMDLLIAAGNGFQSAVFINDGSGVFTASPSMTTYGFANLAIVEDFSGDGDPDAVISTWQGACAFRGNGAGDFHRAPRYASGAATRDVETVDVNGDGFRDLLTIADGSGVFGVRFNDQTGVFGAQTSYSLGFGASRFLARDFDGDTDVDVAITLPGAGVRIFTNNGAGVFAQGALHSVGIGVDGIASADIDGDGDADLAVADGFANTVLILKNNGAGAFTSSGSTAVTGQVKGIAAANLDADMDIDLVVTCFDSDEIAILTNSGTGTFTSSKFVTGDAPAHPALADLDADGKLDLVVPLANEDYARIYKNNGGSFAAPVFVLCGSGPFDTEIGDIDGNGTPDLAFASFSGATLTVFSNLTSMIFLNYSNYDADFGASSLALADLDGNGSNDIAVGSSVTQSAAVMKNSIPTVTSVVVNNDRRMLVTFSEPVTNGDLLTTNYAFSGTAKGTMATFPDIVSADSPTVRTLVWNSGEMFDGGDATISVASFLKDARGNSLGFQNALTDVGGGVGYAPLAAFTTDFAEVTNAASFQVSLNFSENVLGYSDGDLVITNGTLAGSVSAGASVTLDITANAEGPVTISLAADEYADAAGNLGAEDEEIQILYDISPPALAISTIDATRVGPAPMSIGFTAADSAGLGTVGVFARKKGASSFALVDAAVGGSGSIDFAPAQEGVYELAIAGQDILGQGSATPSAPSLLVVYNADGGAFFHDEMESGNSYLFPMTNDLDVTVAISGTPSSPPAIKLNRFVGDGAPVGFDPARLINEHLEIEGDLVGAQATVTWPFDAANAVGLEGPLSKVFQIEGVSVIAEFTANAVPGGIVFGPVTSFSKWWAGNNESAVASWAEFDTR